MFAISGNIIEDMGLPDHFKNYFFRNGMTSAFQAGVNGSTTELRMDQQQRIALLPNDAVIAIPSGMTRFWRTSPEEFHRSFPQPGAPLVDGHGLPLRRRRSSMPSAQGKIDCWKRTSALGPRICSTVLVGRLNKPQSNNVVIVDGQSIG